MIFHLSIAADRPAATAAMIAELLGGRAFPFPPFAEGSWIAMAGDERGSAVEVYPRGAEMHASAGEGEGVHCVVSDTRRHGPCHAAIASALDIDGVLDVAASNGVLAKPCDRGPFRVIELWVDDCFMFEVLTPEMQAEYRRTMTFAGWEGFLAANRPSHPIVQAA